MGGIIRTHGEKKIHYCGLQGLFPTDFLGRSESIFGWYRGNGYLRFTHKGRCGLGLLCLQWNIKPRDEILVPSYNCGTEIDPFVFYGLNVKFYRVDKNARIDQEDICDKITEKTRIVYITHYFGWPQDFEKTMNVCREKGIYVIEDCALSLFSEPVEREIGTLGDAAIYSLPKTLPVPDGGALTIRAGSLLREMPAKKPAFPEIAREMLPYVKRFFLWSCEKLGIYHLLPAWLTGTAGKGSVGEITLTNFGLPGIPRSYYYDENIMHMEASNLSRFILRHSSRERIVGMRRTNYRRLEKALREFDSIKPLFSILPEGVCPLFFPVIVDDCDRLCHGLNERGILAIHWWSGYHRSFDWSDFPEARFLKDNLLVLPIHQRLSDRDMDYIIESIRSLSKNG